MEYLQNKTLELIIFLLFGEDLLEEPPSEFFIDVFASEIDNILEDLRESNIDSCISFGKNKTTVRLIDKASLEKFVDEYIRNFEEDKLDKDLNNYYPLDTLMSIIPTGLLKPYYDKFLKTSFTIDYNLREADFSLISEISKANIRFYELLLYLNNKKYISIHDKFGFVRDMSSPIRRVTREEIRRGDEKYLLLLNINFNKSPMEIYDISKYWLYYGDIRVNETDGIGFYKQNRYPFQHTKGKAFLLLCQLLRNHGKWLSIIDTYNIICPENIEEETKLTRMEMEKEKKNEYKTKKNKIKDYVKEIKKHLKINEDEKPSIFITMNDENVMLISNPPI